MNPFLRLLERHPLIFFHLACAAGAVLLGAVILARRKGTTSHRALGWTWVALMASATLSSAFIRDTGMLNVAGFTPIHLLTVFVALILPRAVWFARTHQIARHRKAMRGLYIGGCAIAGLFTLMPTRFLGRVLWGDVGPWLGS